MIFSLQNHAFRRSRVIKVLINPKRRFNMYQLELIKTFNNPRVVDLDMHVLWTNVVIIRSQKAGFMASIVFIIVYFWKCNFPMNHNVCLSVGLSRKKVSKFLK